MRIAGFVEVAPYHTHLNNMVLLLLSVSFHHTNLAYN